MDHVQVHTVQSLNSKTFQQLIRKNALTSKMCFLINKQTIMD